MSRKLVTSQINNQVVKNNPVGDIGKMCDH